MKEIWLLSAGNSWEEVKEQIVDAIELGFTGVVVENEFADRTQVLGRTQVISRKSENAEFLEIKSSDDQKRAIDISEEKDYLFLKFLDWKIIPLENLVAMKGKAKIVVEVESLEDAKLVLETLEKGADGILVKYTGRDKLAEFASIVSPQGRIELVEAEVVDIVPLGLGDRVCIDTVSMMERGEGMLVGNLSSFMFLVASESEESEYVSSRPFRVNAGSVNAYLKVGERTKYLSELKSGDEVELIRYDGVTRKSHVGRVKIERRPLILLRAVSEGRKGTVILQNAETIKLISPDGSHVSVSSLNKGDKILVWVEDAQSGRHFGTKVEEYVIEK
jgi:3-dehydroquinate synthase II